MEMMFVYVLLVVCSFLSVVSMILIREVLFMSENVKLIEDVEKRLECIDHNSASQYKSIMQIIGRIEVLVVEISKVQETSTKTNWDGLRQAFKAPDPEGRA